MNRFYIFFGDPPRGLVVSEPFYRHELVLSSFASPYFLQPPSNASPLNSDSFSPPPRGICKVEAISSLPSGGCLFPLPLPSFDPTTKTAFFFRRFDT